MPSSSLWRHSNGVISADQFASSITGLTTGPFLLLCVHFWIHVWQFILTAFVWLPRDSFNQAIHAGWSYMLERTVFYLPSRARGSECKTKSHLFIVKHCVWLNEIYELQEVIRLNQLAAFQSAILFGRTVHMLFKILYITHFVYYSPLKCCFFHSETTFDTKYFFVIFHSLDSFLFDTSATSAK